MRQRIADSAVRLQVFLQEVDTPVVHFVGHSLGGLVIRRLFNDFPDQRPGRIVTLGTPHQGSRIARTLGSHSASRWILGRSLEGGLLGELPPWSGERELGSIAGTMSIGSAWVVPGLPSPNDGTVAEVETQLSNMADHVTVRTSHMGLLLSSEAARQVCAFLRTGRFLHQQSDEQ